ncbi:MAG: hypothetical protein H0T79_06025 [Deltaproteobacteria bacterium]|nr:hypothetical protein [Deltaproteobacteria bacterium]
MRRLGYAKLDRYGLLLTPEGRIMSTRPAVLDDGLGGRIVGWTDADLAAMELEKWAPRPISPPATKVAAQPPIPRNHQAVRPAPIQAVASRVASVPAAMPHAFVPTIPAIPAAVCIAKPAPLVEHELTEDEWEWEIAVARARAAADDIALVATPVAAPTRRTRLETVPPPIAASAPKFVPARTLPGVAPMKPAEPPTRDSWVAAQARMDELETTRVDVKAPEPVRALPRAASPRTVIPVPTFPTLSGVPSSHWIEPIVRKAMPTPIPPASPRRFPKGTGPIGRPTVAAAIPDQDATRPMIPMNDQTRPDIAITPIAATRPIPSIKRQVTR